MRWEFEKVIRELREVRSWNHKLKKDEIKKIRMFASKYFKDTWRTELSQFDYSLEQLREFQDLIDWEKWYFWKGRSVPVYILWEFKHKSKYMQKDFEEYEKKFGIQYVRDFKIK